MKAETFLSTILFILVAFSGVKAETGYAQDDPFESQLPKPQVAAAEIIQETPAPLPVEEVINPPAINVNSLIAGGPFPRAIINGKILRVGSEIDGAVIEDISKEGIEVTFKGKSFSYPAPSILLRKTNKTVSFASQEYSPSE